MAVCYVLQDMPSQLNGYDCGVFVLEVLQLLEFSVCIYTQAMGLTYTFCKLAIGCIACYSWPPMCLGRNRV